MQWEVGSALNIASILVVVIVFAAMLIWVERRLLGFWQDRVGPNRVGPFGLLQVVADMIKIFTKEDWIPPFADRFGFVLAPTIIMIVILLSFSVVPFAPGVGIVDSNIGVLFVLAMASLGAYSVMLGGLSSDNKYALLLRQFADMFEANTQPTQPADKVPTDAMIGNPIWVFGPDYPFACLQHMHDNTHADIKPKGK